MGRERQASRRTTLNINVRLETPGDYEAIRRVHDLAFGRSYEAQVADRLRASAAYVPELSLVAELDGEIVGHVILSEAKIEGGSHSWPALVLGPIGVLPALQRQGIGSRLVNCGLERAAAMGYGAVILIGHPTYYPRFGFVPASRYGLKTAYNVADEVFMARLLRPDGLAAISGTVIFPDAFQE